MNQAPASHTPEPVGRGAWSLSSQTTGGLFCVLAALGYTASNFCMKKLAVLGADPTWATCNRETVTVLILGPWLLCEAFRGRRVMPTGRAFLGIAVVSLAVQLLGNQFSQWSMGIIGLAVNIPVIFGMMLLASAVLGWTMLGEGVTRRTLSALGLLLAALVLLGLSAAAGGSGRSAAGVELTLPTVCLAVLASACAGVVYALLSIVIRRTMTGVTRGASMMVIVTGVGTLGLGALSLLRLGPAELAATPPVHFAWMAAAGLANLCGLMAISRGLQLTTVVHANMLNASQVAMAAIGGIWLFGEAFNPWLLLGVGLTIAGIILINRPETPLDAEV